MEILTFLSIQILGLGEQIKGFGLLVLAVTSAYESCTDVDSWVCKIGPGHRVIKCKQYSTYPGIDLHVDM